MTQTIDAIYENGAFRPLAYPPPQFAEGQQVRIVVETNTPDEILAMAKEVYAGLSEQDVRQVEQIALDRSSFFAGREP